MMLKLIDVKAGQKYLDVGCGNGAAAIHLAQKYQLDVTGIDVDPDQIRLAEAHSQRDDPQLFIAFFLCDLLLYEWFTTSKLPAVLAIHHPHTNLPSRYRNKVAL